MDSTDTKRAELVAKVNEIWAKKEADRIKEREEKKRKGNKK
jgi:hypothetical protein